MSEETVEEEAGIEDHDSVPADLIELFCVLEWEEEVKAGEGS